MCSARQIQGKSDLHASDVGACMIGIRLGGMYYYSSNQGPLGIGLLDDYTYTSILSWCS